MASLIALCGFMGSGKSVVGEELSRRLGTTFVDLDLELERSLGIGIQKYFKAHGEAAFREQESALLVDVLSLLGKTGGVLSLGGGALEAEGNRAVLRQQATLVLLDVQADVAWQRVAGSKRPLAQDKQVFAELWASRRATYEENAAWVVPTSDRTVAEVAGDLEELVRAGVASWENGWARKLARTERQSLIVGGPSSGKYLRHAAATAAGQGRSLHVVTDTNVMRDCEELIWPALGQSSDDTLVIEAGEMSKSAPVLERCWDWLAERKARRDDIVVAVGGGVVGDLAGFAAATYHRGVGLWQVPTSLLAQVDSSVGGKTAIDLRAGKNLVGAFHQADLVVIDPAVLLTLPDSEYVGALGEVVKHALLSSERDVETLESSVTEIKGRNIVTLSLLVKRNVAYKASVVESDEREGSSRARLNLGHTVAHALETVLGYGVLSHGQAVALGLLVALAVSEESLGLPKSVRDRTEHLFRELGLRTTIQLPPTDELVAATQRDKKVKAGNTGFVGLRAIGDPVWGLNVPSEMLSGAMEVIGLDR